MSTELLRGSCTYATNRIFPLFFHIAVPRVTAASSPLSSEFCSYPNNRQTLSGSPPYSMWRIYKWDVPNANCIKGPLSLNRLVPSHFTSPSTVAHRSPHQPTDSALISLSISSLILPVLQIC